MNNIKIIHGIVANVVILIVIVFWGSTVISELLLDQQAIKMVKQSIVYYGLPFMVVAMMITGMTGFLLGKESNYLPILNKKKRMPFIIFNGLFVMVPLAIYLNYKAANNVFDTWFFVVQVVELLMGIIQLSLLSKNFMEGIKLTKSFNSW